MGEWIKLCGMLSRNTLDPANQVRPRQISKTLPPFFRVERSLDAAGRLARPRPSYAT